MKTRVVSATEFKAKCLALLDEVEQNAGTITVTKRGRPVAVVGPAKKVAWKSPKGVLAGKVQINEDMLTAGTAGLWNVVRQQDDPLFEP